MNKNMSEEYYKALQLAAFGLLCLFLSSKWKTKKKLASWFLPAAAVSGAAWIAKEANSNRCRDFG